jgi:3-oxoadipate enol-lactonase
MPMVHANDINIYYEVHGTGAPVLIIAGLASDVTDHASMIRELSQHYRVIAFDNRGVGRSDKPDGAYSIDMMADDTAGLLCALGVGPVHVLGISMGGRIAVALALRHPELVKSLILAATYVTRIPPTWRSRLLGVMLLIPTLQAVARGQRHVYSALARQREASRTYDAGGRLHEIEVPTLILHGRNDRRAPLAAAEQTHAGIQGSRMQVFNGGHLFMFVRQRDQLRPALRGALFPVDR